MNATLAQLPVEIVEWICRSLETVDIFSLRLVCRHLADKTTRALDHACFNTVTTDLCSKSLRRIKEILENPRARRAVQNLVITGSLDVDYRKGDLGQDIRGQWYRSPRGSLEAPFPEEVDRFLREVLVDGLPNCHSFTVRGIRGSWNMHDEKITTAYLSVTDALALLFFHISGFHRPVTAFTLDMTNMDRDLDMRPLPADLYLGAGFVNTWSEHIQELNLQACIGWDTSKESEILIRTLIVSTRNLKNLSLDCGRTLELLNSVLSQPTWNPPLRYLRLKNINTDDSKAFLDLTSRFQGTLQTLVLEYVELEAGTWQQFLPALIQRFPHLKRIRLYFLRQSLAGHSFSPVINFWPGRIEKVPGLLHMLQLEERPLIAGADYEGPNIPSILDTLLGAAYFRQRQGRGRAWAEIPLC
ncbi:uncharacterized protein K452DRAFT_306205 [Aplosporella prunicola CBS 121167]|uniref:F-box domain-containing protein n=1 Tax=Aplosporella prunicola CBS 121167 TaxID=1176127 RepID=A0A6A6BPC6_9PEZI|nr:uncharacterized protein K452DRAFT_306205 [Aplosporella prunicola CBS 121167]KAF2145303.1 hypothetical protein K452DRAFT_306205 [Aplosporella prunicola CBS 121167]